MRIHLITAESLASRRLRFRRIIQFAQLTMPWIAGITPPGHEICHTDEIVGPVDLNRPADLVAITTNTPSANHAYRLADAFRSRGVPVVMGGPHPTALPYEALEHCDSVVVGEAEDTWPSLLHDYDQGPQKLIYKSRGNHGLDQLPGPRWDLIKRRWYGKGVTIATRGCPHSCHYCSVPFMYGTGFRRRPAEEVVAEVARMPGRAAVFWDDNIMADADYAKRLFRGLIPLRKWWTSQCASNTLADDELLSLASKSGCQALFLGLETVSQESLDGTNKRHNRVRDYKKLVDRCHSHGIAVHAGIVFGFDSDRPGIFAETLEFLMSAAIDVATISILVPMPGTELFRRLFEEGRILHTDWDKYDGKTHCVFRPLHMTPQQLVDGTQWAARRFYSYRNIVSRIRRSRCGVWWNMPRNLGYNLALKKSYICVSPDGVSPTTRRT